MQPLDLAAQMRHSASAVERTGDERTTAMTNEQANAVNRQNVRQRLHLLRAKALIEQAQDQVLNTVQVGRDTVMAMKCLDSILLQYQGEMDYLESLIAWNWVAIQAHQDYTGEEITLG